jgi:hypothetical protein
MKKLLLLIIFLNPLALHAQQDLVQSVLNEFGLDSSNVGFRPKLTWSTAPHVDPFRLPWFNDLLAKPMKVPNFTQRMLWYYNVYSTADSANMPGYHANKIRPMTMMIVNSARNLGYDVGKYGFDYSPKIAAKNPVMDEIRSIFESYGQTLGDNIVYPLPTQNWSDISVDINNQLESVPAELQQVIAGILEASQIAARRRNESLAAIPRGDWHHIYKSTTLEESQCDAHTFDQKVYDAAVNFDVATCSWGAALLAQAVEKAMPVIRKFKGKDYSFDISTPMGRVLLSGSSDNVHYANDVLLHIDLGGSDKYYGSVAATSPELPISVLIDLDGNDRYENRHKGTPAQAAGILGIALLVDDSGDDSYESVTFSQGCGRFGIGVLADRDGNDVYTSEGFSQGAGMYGIGIILEDKGDDKYNTVYYAQGYGFSKGLGLIMDVEGNDAYTADDSELTHIGDETPKHNESDAQGFGSGRRGDHTDGHNMSGGIGILNDLAGNDTYFAGVFAQASAYWYGYGIINDRSGDDKYRGVFFNLGAAAHFGIASLVDGGGDDYSELVMTLGFGTGHDGSVAYYLDFNGDDTYEMTAADSRAASLGSSLNSSFSFFANIRGNDTYKPVGRSFGFTSARHKGERALYGPTLGIFIDIGGDDIYEGEGPANNTRWHPVEMNKNKGLYSIGIDAAEGSIKFERE